MISEHGEVNQDVVGLVLVTDCRSLYDCIKKESSLPEDRRTALTLASLKQSVSAGVGRNTRKARLMWVPTRSQHADGLTKSGLGGALREFMTQCTVRFHEVSAKVLKMAKSS